MHHLTPNTWPFGQRAARPSASSLLLQGVKPVHALPGESWERKASTSVPWWTQRQKTSEPKKSNWHSYFKEIPADKLNSFKKWGVEWMKDGFGFIKPSISAFNSQRVKGGNQAPQVLFQKAGRRGGRLLELWSLPPPSREVSRESDLPSLSPPSPPPPLRISLHFLPKAACNGFFTVTLRPGANLLTSVMPFYT